MARSATGFTLKPLLDKPRVERLALKRVDGEAGEGGGEGWCLMEGRPFGVVNFVTL